MHRRSPLFGLLTLHILALGGGCIAVDAGPTDPPGAASSTSAGSGGAGSSASSGDTGGTGSTGTSTGDGAGGCDAGDDRDEPCMERTCVDGTIVSVPVAIDTPCSQDGGSFCSADGACVECNAADQCGTDETCDESHHCVADPCAATTTGISLCTATGSLELWLDPTSIEASGGVVTAWKDLSGHGRDAVPSGGPTKDSSTGLDGVSFDGVDDHFDGPMTLPSDQPLTVFVLSRTVPKPPGYIWQLELSDNGASGRSLQIMDVYSFRNGRLGERPEEADVGYVYSGTSLALHRFDIQSSDRVLLENGQWKASTGVPIPLTRSTSVFRLGESLADTGPWSGVIDLVMIYSGAMSEKDRESIESQILTRAGLPHPYRWPSKQSTEQGDPLLALPDVTDAIAGQAVTIWKDSIHDRDGQTTQVVTSDLPVDESYPDRWIVVPPSPGDYTFKVTEGAYEDTTVIRAVAPLAATAPKKRVLFVGDSNTHRGAEGFIQYIGDTLGPDRVEIVGTEGPSAHFSYKHEGRDGWGWKDFDAAGSPFFSGAQPDIANYIAQIGGPPDVIYWMLWANDVYGATDATIDGLLTTSVAHANHLITAWQAAVPGIRQIVSTPVGPSSGDPVIIGPDVAGYIGFRKMLTLAARACCGAFEHREAESIFVAPTFFQFDRVRGYGDGLHPNSAPGHRELAVPILTSLVSHGWP